MPKLNKVLIGLDLPLTKVKTKLLNDGDDDLVVSASRVRENHIGYSALP